MAALGGCAIAPPTIQRWSAVSGLPPSAPPELRVTSAPAQSPDALTAKGLPDHGAGAYIAALAGMDKKPKDLRADVARPIKAPAGGIADGTVVGRVVLVTVERPTVRPGDRLLMTRVILTPADPNVTFTDYQLAATERSAISVGSVTISDTVGGSVSAGPGPAAAASLLPSASLSASQAQGASRTVSQEAIFAVSAEPDRIEVFRTGAEDRDLMGNTLIKVSLRFGSLVKAPIFYVADVGVLDEDTGAPLEPAKVAVNLAPLALYAPRDLWVCARMDYEDRQVADPRSEDEGKQAATIVNGATPLKAYKIAPYQDLQQLLWKIHDADGSYVAFSDALTVRELSFDDYDSAAEFLAWLKLKRPAAIKNGRLGVNAGAMLASISRFDRLVLEPVAESIGAPGDPPSCPK